ncbi:MAG: M56 family metallopeptidase [Phycisphaerae bacterium]|nr:M56 family metallopeptidase [Phycisphaerae bacterium]
MTEIINGMGRGFCDWAATLFVQVGVLVVVLLCVDLCLHKRVRATLRYWIWMLVFVKLLLPPSLSVPTGIGYWFGGRVSLPSVVSPQAADTPVTPVRMEPDTPVEMPSAGEVSSLPAPTAPVEPVTIGAERLTWHGGVFLLWSVGVLVFAAMVVQRLFYVRRLITHAEPTQGDVPDVLDECRRRMHIRRNVRLRLSPIVFSPAVCGLLRPTILMPTALLERLSPESLRAVLIHELAHVKRGDLWVNSLQTVLQVVYFYNPLVWLANAIVRRAREQAVDEMVLVALDAQAQSYGNTLIDIAEMTFLRASPALRLIGVAESRKSLEGRIKHMMTRPIPKNARVGVIGAFVVIAIGAVLLPMATANTETAEPEFTGGLANDAVVEFVGICSWATEKPVCWKPDGLPFEMSARPKAWDRQRAVNGRGFIFRVVPRSGADLTWVIDGAQGSSSVNDIVDARGDRLEDYWAITASMAEGLKQTTVRVGVANGPWRTVGSHDGRGVRAEGGDAGGTLWSQAFEDPEGMHVVVSTQGGADFARRVVATDRSGMICVPSGTHCVSVTNVVQLTATFRNIRRGDIKEFQYQVRPYEWVRFADVSLTPGVSSSVRVEAETTPSQDVSPGKTDASQSPPLIAARSESAERLAALGKAALLYTIDHEDRLPDRIEDLPDESGLAKSWLIENVTYLGKHMRTYNEPDTPIAYDKTLLLAGQGTNVLHLDTQVVFEGPERLKELGIIGVPPESRTQLERLGKSLLIYASQNQHKYPDTLQDARDYIDKNCDYSWVLANVTYLGKGGTPREEPGRVLAYDKSLLKEGKSTNALYRDCHVAWVRVDPREATTGSQNVSWGEQEVPPSPPLEAARVESAEQLRALGKAAIVYAAGHEDRLPDQIEDLPDDPGLAKPWWIENVVYLGKGVKTHDEPGTPIAFDKTLLLTQHRMGGTNVLYLDAQVAFEDSSRIERLGILRSRKESQMQMTRLGKSLHIYASDHYPRYPDTLQDAQDYIIREECDLSWILANAAYLGRGQTLDEGGFVLAYDKTLLNEGEGTTVLYRDGRVKWAPAHWLPVIGVPASRLIERAVAMRRLRDVAVAAIQYADEHDGSFARDMGELKPSIANSDVSAWMMANVEYLAAGIKADQMGATATTRPLAYWKTAPPAFQGTAVAFFDTHVEFIATNVLASLGIRLEG